MQKIIVYIILILALSTLLVASSPLLMSVVIKYIPSPYRYGDLYMFSDLKLFKYTVNKQACPPFKSSHHNLKNVNLYVLGDSFTQRMDSDDFISDTYKFIHWDYYPRIIHPLDTLKKNILIIESVEAFARSCFQQPADNHILVLKNYDPAKDKGLRPHLFNIKAEYNLDYLLDHSAFISFFKEIKAWINLTLFNRIDENVSFSNDQQHLFLKETTDSSLIKSSFNNLTDAELDTMVRNINITYKHFLSIGFSQVYLTIVPNEVSVIDPGEGHYNHLIERVEAYKQLKMPVLDVYHSLKKAPLDYYFKSDSHWNCNGRYIWLQKVDSLLYSTSENTTP